MTIFKLREEIFDFKMKSKKSKEAQIILKANETVKEFYLLKSNGFQEKK